jgi:hypothetical protein
MKPDVKVFLLRQRATILTGSMDENGMNRKLQNQEVDNAW